MELGSRFAADEDHVELQPNYGTASPSPASHPDDDGDHKRPLAVVFTMLSCLLLTGFSFGVVALQPALVQAGAFGNLCEPQTPAGTTCHRQRIALSQVFALVIGLGLAAEFFIGYAADRLGPRRVMRVLIVVAAVGIGMAGIDIRNGAPFAIGMVLFSLMGGPIGAVASALVLPAGVDESELEEKWIPISVTITDIGCACVVPIGWLMQWTVFPLWLWFVILGVAVLGIFLPLHHGGVVDPDDPNEEGPLSTGNLSLWATFVTLIKSRNTILLCVSYGVVNAFCGAIEAASSSLYVRFGGEFHTTKMVLVPLVVGGAGLAVALIFTLFGFDQVRLGAILRMGSLAAVAAIFAWSDSTPAFWGLLFCTGFLRCAAMCALGGVAYSDAPANLKGTQLGLIGFVSSSAAIPPTLLLTYIFTARPEAVGIAVAVGVFGCVVGEVLLGIVARDTRSEPPSGDQRVLEGCPTHTEAALPASGASEGRSPRVPPGAKR